VRLGARQRAPRVTLTGRAVVYGRADGDMYGTAWCGSSQRYHRQRRRLMRGPRRFTRLVALLEMCDYLLFRWARAFWPVALTRRSSIGFFTVSLNHFHEKKCVALPPLPAGLPDAARASLPRCAQGRGGTAHRGSAARTLRAPEPRCAASVMCTRARTQGLAQPKRTHLLRYLRQNVPGFERTRKVRARLEWRARRPSAGALAQFLIRYVLVIHVGVLVWRTRHSAVRTPTRARSRQVFIVLILTYADANVRSPT
jgi:hypothetical protein